MFTTLSTALSALNANSIAVSAVGNDLANLDTTGYKTTEVAFETLMAQTMGGTNGFSLGMGTARPQTITQYTQGGLQTGLGGLNAAVQGQGFFMVADGKGNTLYTRDGTFTTGASGYLVDANGLRVQGWSAGANGVVNTNGATGDITIPSGTLFPPVASTNVTLSMNLDSAALAGTTTGVTSGIFSQPITVYDSLGTAHTLTATFTKNEVQTSMDPGYKATAVTGTDVDTFNVSAGGTPTTVTIAASDGTTLAAQVAALNTKLASTGITASINSTTGELQFASNSVFSISASTTNTTGNLVSGATPPTPVDNTSLYNSAVAITGGPQELDITVGTASDPTIVKVPNIGQGNGGIADEDDVDAVNAALKAAGVTGVTATLDANTLTPATVGPPATEATSSNIQLQGTASFSASYNSVSATVNPPAVGSQNTWNYSVTMPGSDLASGTTATVASGQLTFDPTTGQLKTPPATGGTITLSTGSGTKDAAGALNNGAVMNDITWDLYDSSGNPLVTQVDQASAVSANTADGSAAAQLTQVTMGDGGQLMAQFSNGKSVAIAQLSIANIPNPNSMLSTGNNDFEATSQTAAPIVGTANTGGRGNVVGGALEQSTVDIATEFSNLITLQNAYQANSRVITTEDQILQQTVSLIQP
jgi:flagellar hook protein FlgE